jgi:hypothetical protein
MAREVGFVQRSTSRIEGDDFVKLFTSEVLTLPAISLAGMCDLLRQLNPKADMSPQALSERIGTASAVNYLKETLNSALQESLSLAGEEVTPSLLASFNRVLLEDSTQISLHEKLADAFKGAGGSASKAGLKIDLVYDFTGHVIQQLSITAASVPDQAKADGIVELLQEGDLVIRDLGYFCLKIFPAIAAKGAFYLSRLLSQVCVYLSHDSQAAPVDLVDYLDKKYAQQNIIDFDVYIGKDRLPCRLIAYRAPEAVVNERIRKAADNAKKKGRQLTDNHKKWLRFTFFVTNVSRDVWQPEVVGTIYRLRWQIELIFKSWKSLCHIHVLKGQRPERVECFIYGRLIAIVLITVLYGFASWYSHHELDREASLHKLIDWLKRKERLSAAFRFSGLELLMTDLINDLTRMLCKQKRNRQTTQQLIKNEAPYTDTFTIEDDDVLQLAA